MSLPAPVIAQSEINVRPFFKPFALRIQAPALCHDVLVTLAALLHQVLDLRHELILEVVRHHALAGFWSDFAHGVIQSWYSRSRRNVRPRNGLPLNLSQDLMAWQAPA